MLCRRRPGLQDHDKDRRMNDLTGGRQNGANLEDRLNKTAQESEEKLKAVAFGSPIPQFVINRDHRIIFWNRPLEEISGIKAGEVIGTKQQWRAFYHEPRPCIADLLVDGDLEGIRQWYGAKCGKSKLVTGAYEATEFFPMLGKEGKWLHFTAAAIKDSKGNILGAVETLEDITERKLAEEALRESEQRYRSLFEDAPLMYVITRNEHGVPFISDCNELFLSSMGYTRETVVGRPLADFYSPESRVELLERGGYARALAGEIFIGERDLLTSDGRLIQTLLHTTTEVDRSGYVTGTRAMFVDIAKRKKAEEAADRANKEWERTFNAVSDLIMVLDDQHKILRANKAMADALGMREQELIGKPCFELVHGEKQPPVFCPHSRLLANGEEHCAEVVEPCFKGIYDVRVSPLFDQNGKVIGSVHITRDITERKRTEEIERETARFRAVADLAGGVAHNFNNLLQIVISNLELAIMNLETANYIGIEDALQNVLESSRFGAETVRRLQSFAGIRDHSRPSEKGAFDLSGIVRQAIEMSKTWWKAIPEKQGINVSLEMELQDGCLVQCEKSELFEVVVNVVRNAAEALPQGGAIYVKTHVEGDSVVFKIRDTGIGINEQNLKRLFNPFFTTKAKAGSGLGLASSRKIIQDCGGNIVVESSEGKGTTFTILLPLARGPSEQPEVPTEVSGSTMTILVIEDTEAVSDALEAGLTMFGHVVLTASSGSQGLEIFKENPVDLVICDLGMPGINGWEVAKRVRSTCEERHISKTPFILLTGWGGQKTEVRKIAESGVDAVVEKPINLENILKIVRDLGEKIRSPVSQ